MKVEYTRGALGVVLCALVSLPAFAQHEDHQAPGAAASAPAASLTSCAQGSQGVTRSIDVLSARIEEARQTNDAAKMRAAVADLQVALAQMKNQLNDCTALTQGASMGNMAGMNHSKMPMAPGTPVPQPATASGPGASSPAAKAAPPAAGMDHSKMQMPPKSAAARSSGAAAKAVQPAPGMDHSKMTGGKTPQGAAVVFTLRTDPAPLRMGKNDFEVSVKDAEGKPIADADVSLAFYMPPMASMNMPEMRNTVKLTSAGNGIYKGSGTLGMAGDWDVTVTASRNGQQLDVRKMKLTAK